MASIEKLAMMVADSRLRTDTLMYLYKNAGSEVRVKTIAEDIKANRENVLGALRGMKNRYKKECSLAYLELAYVNKAKENGHACHLSRIAPLGAQVAEYLIKKSKN